MNRVRHLNAAKLNTNYAHSNTLGNFAKNMRDEAQRGLEFNEQKKQSGISNNYNNEILGIKKQTLAEAQEANRIAREGAVDKKKANATMIKTMYPNYYGKVQASYGDTPSAENAQAMNNYLENADISQINENRDFQWDKSKFGINKQIEIDKANATNTINAGKAGKLTPEQTMLYSMMGVEPPKTNGVYAPKISVPNGLGNYSSNNISVANTPTNKATQKIRTKPIIESIRHSTPIAKNTAVEKKIGTPIKIDWENQEVGYENKKSSFADVSPATSKMVTVTTDENGNKVQTHNITGRKVLLGKASKEKQNEIKDEEISLLTTIENADNSLAKIDGIINNKGLNSATGWMAPLALIPESDARGIHAEVESLKGATFLSAIKEMKGMGALSDAEGKKVSDAVANLDMYQSTEQLKKQLNYIKTIMSQAKRNAMLKLKSRKSDIVETQKNNSRQDLKSKVLKELGMGQ